MEKILRELLDGTGLPTWLVPDYWFMLTLALVAGSLLTLSLWKRSGQERKVASDLLFWSILALFVGAKLFNFLQFGFPRSLSGFWSTGGFALYGGLFGVLTACTVYYFIHPYPIRMYLDCVAPALALGLFLGRIGCFLAGCNGGIPSDLPWGVRFPRDTPVFYHQSKAGLIEGWESFALPAHPTQLYESLFGLTALMLLLLLFREKQRDGGQVFFTGMLWYAVYRFATEPLRADTGGLHPFDLLTFSQFVSLLVGVGAIAAFLHFGRQEPAAHTDPTGARG